MFIFTLLCGASKGFMKALKAFNFQKCMGREILDYEILIMKFISQAVFSI